MSLKAIFLTTVGTLVLGIGAVGLFLPILPTTPFVLLAAACFGASSPKLYHRLAQSTYFGAYITNYKTKQGVPKRIKIQSLVFLWAMLLLSIFWINSFSIRALLVMIGFAVSLHICTLKTKK